MTDSTARPLSACLLLLLVACATTTTTSTNTNPPEASSAGPDEVEPPSSEPQGVDAGARVWLSSPTTVEGSEPIVALLQVKPVEPDERRPELEGASAELELLLRHPDAEVRVCGVGGLASCPECVLKSATVLPVALDCALAAGTQYESRRQARLSFEGDAVVISLEGDTGFKVPVPMEYRLERTSPMRLAFTELAKKGFGNRSSETAHLGSLVDALSAEADRRTGGADEVDALIASFGVDPMTVPVDFAIKLREAVQELNMRTLRFPDARREMLPELVRDHLEDAGVLPPPEP